MQSFAGKRGNTVIGNCVAPSVRLAGGLEPPAAKTGEISKDQVMNGLGCHAKTFWSC